MNTETNASQQAAERPTLSLLWQDIKKHKRLYYKVLSITFVVSAILLIGTPNYYRCTVKLAPELSGSKSTSSLASIASSFGINLGSGSMGSEALFPTLYPDLMNSVAFRASLFSIKVQRKGEDTTMTYYDYLSDGQKMSLLGYVMLPIKWAKESLVSLIKGEEEESTDKVDPFKLTKEQYATVEVIEDKVVCDVDNKTLVITIDVTDQDPLIAATMADSVQLHLQEFITNYRTQKARVDLEYNQKLFEESKERYESARKRYAAYADANRNVLFEKSRSEQMKLENEMNLQYQAYSQVAAQLRLAEAKVQEDTPAFTTLQPAFVPIKKAGPRRIITCLLILFFMTILCTIFVLYKENGILSLFNRNGNVNEMEEVDEEYYILSKMPSNK